VRRTRFLNTEDPNAAPGWTLMDYSPRSSVTPLWGCRVQQCDRLMRRGHAYHASPLGDRDTATLVAQSAHLAQTPGGSEMT